MIHQQVRSGTILKRERRMYIKGMFCRQESIFIDALDEETYPLVRIQWKANVGERKQVQEKKISCREVE